MKPPFNITVNILNLCTEITHLLGEYDGLKQPAPSPILRKQNRIKTIHSSLAIEGNTLGEDQIKAIFDNKRVIGPKKDILEVQNAIRVYDAMKTYNIDSIKHFLRAHKDLMAGLARDAGNFRSGNVGIFQGQKLAHMAPKAHFVPSLIEKLFDFLKENNNIHPLIKSSVFHYETEFIHPFSDGNGRMGRLWQTAILTRFHPAFEYIPIETLIRKKQKKYYKVLSVADKSGDSTVFIEFMLENIVKVTADFFKDFRPQTQTRETRIALANNYFKKSKFSRKDYLEFHKNISTATASRDLQFGIKSGGLKKTGTKALTRYFFIS